MPEPVDTALFSPPLQRNREPLQEPDSLCLLARALFLHTDVNLSTVDPSPSRRRWELRKGWDLLLDGYWREFESSGSEGQWPVVLKLKTYLPSWEAGPSDLNTWVVARAKKNYGKSREQLPAVVFITEDLSREALRDAYAEADAFVLPTRGEGWGLPIAEAMAMELPVIVSLKLATNWSGPTAFLSSENSFALPVAHYLPGGQAEPSVAVIRKQMRAVFEDGNLAKRRGKQAREDMVRRFSPDQSPDKFKNTKSKSSKIDISVSKKLDSVIDREIAKCWKD
ncbi:MAG: hypothetical protein SGPRY_007197 [Prymnesium sp.]